MLDELGLPRPKWLDGMVALWFVKGGQGDLRSSLEANDFHSA